ncbi:MAG: hypothetical protein ACTHN0_17035 [Aquihabitans sp.]
MSDLTPPDAERPSDPPVPPTGFAGTSPPPAEAAPTGFADYRAYAPPNVVAPTPAPRQDPPSSARGGRNPLPVIIGVVVVAAVAIGAFVLFTGGSDDDTADATASDAVLAWAGHMADQDYAAACKVMATASIDRISSDGTTCAAALKALDPDGLYSKAGSAEAITEVVTGSTAQVTLNGGGTALDGKVIVAVKEDGTWRASPFDDGAGDGSETEPTPAPNPSDNVDASAAAACRATLSTTETAAEAYEAVHGEPPADAQALVDDGLLRSLPENVEVAPDGTVTGTGPCA